MDNVQLANGENYDRNFGRIGGRDPMITPTNPTVKPRTPIKTYHPTNAPNRTACVVYVDPVLGLVARSERSTLGIMRVSTSINFDAGVFDRLQADGVVWLEVYVRDIQQTYRATVETMTQHGKRQRRAGLQIALSLKYWQTAGSQAATPHPTQSRPEKQTPGQLTLFEVKP